MVEYLKKLGYNTVNAEFYGQIKKWLGWYKGKVGFHSYYQYNGKNRIGRERATLGMAKKVCEDWANLLMNEKVGISVPDNSANERLGKILGDNNFRVRANQLIELAFALGTGAFVEYADNGNVIIDYIRADMIFPLSWENGEIVECAFASEKIVNNKECVYINLHVRDESGYKVINKLLDKRTIKEIPLPAGVESEYYTGYDRPLFQIITPNIINNADLGCPLGISVFANAIDVLKGIDLVYDSYQNEFRLGKKRIVVPAGMAQIQNEKTGMAPIFDDNDTEFYAMPDKSLTDLKEINMEIRSTPHKEALKQSLSLLADKCGLGGDRYDFERGGIKTATEVISERSDMFQNLRKHEIVLTRALEELAYAVLYLDGIKDSSKLSVRIDFDDSIITDRQTEFEQRAKLVTLGVITAEEFREWYGA